MLWRSRNIRRFLLTELQPAAAMVVLLKLRVVFGEGKPVLFRRGSRLAYCHNGTHVVVVIGIKDVRGRSA